MERLSISGRKVDRRFLRAFSRIPLESLTHLRLSGNQLYRDPRSVKLLMKHLPMQSLQHLDLSWNGLDAKAVSLLSRKSMEHVSLLSLRLSGNPIGPEGLAALLEHGQLKLIPTIDLWDCDVGDEGAKLLGDAMARGDARFHRLVLDMNGIGNSGVQALASGLVHCPSLSALELYCNSIDEEGIQLLAPALKLSHVQHLNLSANRVGPIGAKILANVLAETSLRTLMLCHNGIGDEGAGYLASALTMSASREMSQPNTPALEELSLRFNQLSIHSIRAFATMLSSNKLMKRLFVTGNSIDRRDALLLVSILQTVNKTLLDLQVLERSYENHLVNDKIGLYTAANGSGRQYWGDVTIPLSSWSHKMSCMNPDSLFWFLKERPDAVSSGY